jgi:hypothetical protein
MSAPIFISYSRQDAPFVLRLGRDLRAAGVDLWVDQLDIPAGKRWDREVERALAGCQTLLVVLSPDSASSENVMDEVAYALGESKRVVPVISRPCEVPFRLRRLQHVDLSGDYDGGVERLLATLRGRPDAMADIPPPLGHAPGRLAGRGVLAAAGGAVVLLAAGTLWVASRGPGEQGAPEPAPAATVREPPPPAPAAAWTPGDVPFFMTREVTDADLRGRSTWELDVMRNEIFARHGRRFARRDLQAHFDQQPWYRPQYGPEEFPMSLLSAVQKRNADLIQEYQRRLAR